MIQCRHCRATITWTRVWSEWLDASGTECCKLQGGMAVHEPLIPDLHVPAAVRRWLEL